MWRNIRRGFQVGRDINNHIPRNKQLFIVANCWTILTLNIGLVGLKCFVLVLQGTELALPYIFSGVTYGVDRYGQYRQRQVIADTYPYNI